jgi:succinate-acetate transporter protein
VFQTCYDAADCNNDTGNWALDISTPEGSFKIVTPEPAPFGLAGFGLAIVVGLALSKRKVTFCKFN